MSPAAEQAVERLSHAVEAAAVLLREMADTEDAVALELVLAGFVSLAQFASVAASITQQRQARVLAAVRSASRGAN